MRGRSFIGPLLMTRQSDEPESWCVEFPFKRVDGRSDPHSFDGHLTGLMGSFAAAMCVTSAAAAAPDETLGNLVQIATHVLLTVERAKGALTPVSPDFMVEVDSKTP